MSRQNVERFSSRRVRVLGWTSVALAGSLILHAVLYVAFHSLPGLIGIHVGAAVFAGLASLVMASANIRDHREDVAGREAYDAGRADAIAVEIVEIAQRINRVQ